MLRTATSVLTAVTVCAPLFSQCGPQWLPGEGYLGVNDVALVARMWDEDGPGPMPSKLVVGGDFTAAGNFAAPLVALFDGSDWKPLGSNLGGNVSTLATLPDGSLYAGGYLYETGGTGIQGIARWNGTTWVGLPGGPTSGTVYNIQPTPAGDLIVCGQFANPTRNIIRYSPSTGQWAALGEGLGRISDHVVRSTLVLPNGDILASGSFEYSGTVPITGIARWDGSSWQQFPGVSTGSPYLKLAPNGDLIAYGRFKVNGESAYTTMARWNGSTWISGGPNVTSVSDIHIVAENDYIVTSSTASGSVNYIGRWNGTTYSALVGGGTNTPVRGLCPAGDGSLYVVGDFTQAGNINVGRVARWTNSGWSSVGGGSLGYIQDILPLAHNDVIVAGFFSQLGGTAVNNIARWNGAFWSPLGAGVNSTVQELLRLPNGNIVAGGSFTSAGGSPANRIAEWNGSTWSQLGGGVSGGSGTPNVSALALLTNGDLVVGGSFATAGSTPASNIARWDGSSWHALGSGTNTPVFALWNLPGTDLAVGGGFSTAGGITVNGVARWSPSTNLWSAFGQGVGPSVQEFAILDTGELVAGGQFAGGYVKRWTGSTWSLIGSGTNHQVMALIAHPAGGLVAGGWFTDGNLSPVMNYIGRWDGTTWQPLGAGMDNYVYALAMLPDGDLLAGGTFNTAGGNISRALARWTESPAPKIAVQPQSLDLTSGATLVLNAFPTNGYSNVTVQWYRNGVPINDGPEGAAPGGGIVAGAHTSLPSPTRRSETTLTITNAQAADAGDYTAVFTNPCGSTTTSVAFVFFAQPCATADFDGDGDFGTDADIEAFFTCLAGNCCSTCWHLGSDFNADGDYGTDADIEAFFRVLGGGNC